MIGELSHTDAGLWTFFHCSSVRRSEVHEVAVEYGLKADRYPTYFEVRYLKFTSNMFD